ncbi:MAG: alkaline phosphatase [Chthonomonadales bacterium]|nr:alkaline phosphatase [Chthonomonadales bacterium]
MNGELINRREFVLQAGAAAIGAAAASRSRAEVRGLALGLCADVHYADAEPRGTRHYRLSLERMREAAATWNRHNVDGIVQLGDLIDAGPRADVQAELGYLRTIEKEFRKGATHRFHVLGNHCVATLTKEQFLKAVGQRRAHFSYDLRGFHMVILDACYRRDGVPYGEAPFDWTDTDIPRAERDWLAADLAHTSRKTLVFVHQRLDLPTDSHYAIRSSPEVRAILEQSGKVIGVFMGHSHENDVRRIGGIPYVALSAMVEGPVESGNAFAIIHVAPDGALTFEGFGRMAGHPIG